MNKKGFTLVELLAVLALLGLIASISIYVVLNVVSSAKEKSYEVTLVNIESQVSSYVTENKDKLFFIASHADATDEYQCITVKNLIDFGYLDNSIINSKVSEDELVNINNYVYIERNIITKAIKRSIYVTADYPELASVCGISINATGEIRFSSNPPALEWSKYKDITIAYRLNNVSSSGRDNYNYNYEFSNNNYEVLSDTGMTKVIRVYSDGNIYADIRKKSDNSLLIPNTYSITNVDTVGPTISVSTNTSTVRKSVTIPITVSDVGSGVNHDSFTKDDIQVKVGSTILSDDNITLTKSNNQGLYALKIDNIEYDGKVTIIIPGDSILDNVSNGNSNFEQVTNITFNNIYQITFNANSGTLSGTNPLYTRYDRNVVYTTNALTTTGSIPTATRSGYILAGWYTASSGGSKVLNANGSFTGTAVENYVGTNKWTPSDNMTLYARWTAKTYTVNYYQGNGTSTAGSSLLGSSVCTFATACTLKTYATDLEGIFPYSTEDNVATGNTNYGWIFYGWSTSQTGTTRTYTNSQSINPSTYSETINLYAIGSKTYYFSGGVAPVSRLGSATQYWNPYSTSTDYVTAINVPAKVDISGWTFLGYIGGTNTAASATVHIPASAAGTSYKVSPITGSTGTTRSKYQRTLTINYDSNGGSGTLAASTLVQYYNSGYGNAAGTANTGSTLGANTIVLKDNTFTKSGYSFGNWTAGSTSGTAYTAGSNYTALGSSITDATLSTTMFAKWVDDGPPVASIESTTSTLKATSQTVSVKCTDSSGVTKWYWGTSNSPADSAFTTITSTTTFTKTNISVTAAGTYYLICKDVNGNTSNKPSKVFYTYTINNMLQNASGTNAYTSGVYTQTSTNTYLAPSGTTLTPASLYTIPSGSRSGRFVGVSEGAASTTAATPSTTAPTLNGNKTYSMWFTRNIIYIRYQLQSGETLTATTTNSDGTATYNWTKNSDNVIMVNGSVASSNYRYNGSSNTTIDLANYNNTHYLNITKDGYGAVSGSEWICASGCKTTTQTITHSSTSVNLTNICSADLTTSDCVIWLKVNWTLKPLWIYYHPNGGSVTKDGYTTYNGWVSKDGTKYFYQTVNSGATTNLYNYTTFGITRTGYSVPDGTEWCTTTAGGGTCFDHDVDYTFAQFKAASTEKTDHYELNVYTHWSANTYTVTYNKNTTDTVSSMPANGTKTYGTNYTIPSTKPTRSKYSFVAWNTASDGTGTSYAPGATYSSNAAITLYAVWLKTSGCYRVKTKSGVGVTCRKDPKFTVSATSAVGSGLFEGNNYQLDYNSVDVVDGTPHLMLYFSSDTAYSGTSYATSSKNCYAPLDYLQYVSETCTKYEHNTSGSACTTYTMLVDFTTIATMNVWGACCKSGTVQNCTNQYTPTTTMMVGNVEKLVCRKTVC